MDLSCQFLTCCSRMSQFRIKSSSPLHNIFLIIWYIDHDDDDDDIAPILIRLLDFFVQFGGKLVCFEHIKASPSHQQHQPSAHTVTISQVVTETELVQRSLALEETLSNGRYVEFCDAKIVASTNESESNIWRFLKVPFLLFISFVSINL